MRRKRKRLEMIKRVLWRNIRDREGEEVITRVRRQLTGHMKSDVLI